VGFGEYPALRPSNGAHGPEVSSHAQR